MTQLDMRSPRVPVCLLFAALLLLQAPPAQAGFDTTGPYRVAMVEEPSLPNHTIYRPVDLAAISHDGLPVVVWGNGACGNAGNAFDHYLAEVASQGFLVIANGPIQRSEFVYGRPLKPGTTPPQGAAGPPVPSSVAQMTEAIDWAQRAAKAPGPLHGKIAASLVAVAGQSCGGLQALAAAADPRVTTVVILNSGVIRQRQGSGGGLPPAVLKKFPSPDLRKLHTPVLYVIGGPSDIAYENANSDYDEISGVPVFRLDTNTGHDGTYWEPHGGRFADVVARWLLWQLKHDQQAARLFAGSQCGLCSAPEWLVRRKGWTW